MFNWLKNPEWVAAVALLIQAVILFLQAKILSAHARTMEEHKTIAGNQATTAGLISVAIEQQRRILEEQFNFQKKVESKSEEQTILRLVTDVAARVSLLEIALSQVQLSNYTSQDRDRVRLYYAKLNEIVLPCELELVTSIHMSEEAKIYFLRYIAAVADLKETASISKDIERMKALQTNFADFTAMLIKMATANH